MGIEKITFVEYWDAEKYAFAMPAGGINRR